MKPEYKIISDLIEKDAKVLDVGCDDGTLMEFLKTNISNYNPTRSVKPLLLI